MTYPHRRSVQLAPFVLTCAFVLALVVTYPTAAHAEACPGSGPAPACPYASAAIVGQRAESVLRFPEAVAVDAAGDVYVADQLSYVVQKFNSSGQYLGEWGSYGGGHGQFGPIGGLATDAAGNVYVVNSAHDRIEKFNSEGQFIKDWGHKGSELGDFEFGSSQNYTQPPGGGIAVAGEYVYVADSGNNRIERFNLEGEEPIEWGEYGSEPGQFSYPRGIAANATEVLVADDDNHRIEKFSPSGTYEESVGSNGTGPGHFGFPYGIALDAAGDVYIADDINHRIVKLDPELGPGGEWGSFGTGPGQLAFPRALASDPAGDTYVADTADDRVDVFDPSGTFLRTIGTPAREVPGAFVAPRGVAVDPTGRVYVSDTDDNRILSFAPGGGAFLGAWTATGGYKPGYYEPQGLAFAANGSVYVADTGNARVARLWGEGMYLSELGGPADLGGAGLNGVSSVATSGAGDVYVADTNHNRILVYSSAGTLLAKVGAGEGNGSPGDGPGQFNHPQSIALAPSGNVFVADTGNNRIVELLRERDLYRRVRRARLGRRAPAQPDRGRSGRRRARVCRRQHEQPRRGVRRIRPLPRQVGLPRGRSGRALPAERDRGRLRRQRICRRHEQQPRRALRPGLARRGGLRTGERLAATAERTACAARQPVAQLGRALAACARANGELRTGLQDTRHRHALAGPVRILLAQRGRTGRRGTFAAASRPRTRAPACRQLSAEPPAPGAGTPPDDGRDCPHRRRRADRSAHDRHARVRGHAIMLA